MAAAAAAAAHHVAAVLDFERHLGVAGRIPLLKHRLVVCSVALDNAHCRVRALGACRPRGREGRGGAGGVHVKRGGGAGGAGPKK